MSINKPSTDAIVSALPPIGGMLYSWFAAQPPDPILANFGWLRIIAWLVGLGIAGAIFFPTRLWKHRWLSDILVIIVCALISSWSYIEYTKSRPKFETWDVYTIFVFMVTVSAAIVVLFFALPAISSVSKAFGKSTSHSDECDPPDPT